MESIGRVLGTNLEDCELLLVSLKKRKIKGAAPFPIFIDSQADLSSRFLAAACAGGITF